MIETEVFDVGAHQIKRQALDTLFAKAMAGLIPRPRALKSNEPDTLDERHLHAILLRSGGMTQARIADYMGWTESWTSVVLNHPDAQYVLTRIVSYAADNVIDMEARIKAYAPEALDTVVEVMRSSNDEKVRSNNAFEVLKMAGYGSKKDGAGVNVTINNGVPSATISALADVIRESREIKDRVYELPADANVSEARTLTEGAAQLVEIAEAEKVA